MSEERWAFIEDLDGQYQVSTLGRIRRTRAMGRGALPAWGLINCSPNNHGYPMFNTSINRRRVNVALHLVVLRAFVGPRPDGLQGAHLNGDKLDAALSNLAYVTAVENNSHKVAHGTAQRGENCGAAKLRDADVLAIRASTERYPILAQRYGLCRSHISDIRRGAVWKHLPLGGNARAVERAAPAELEPA